MDEGHNKLIAALSDLLDRAREFEFHDFKNTTAAFPKKLLHEELMDLSAKVRTGVYDD